MKVATSLPVSPDEHALLSPRAAAAEIGYQKEWLMQHKDSLKIPHVRFGRRCFFRRSDLRAWLDRHVVHAVR
jgi:hypothetical protein